MPLACGHFWDRNRNKAIVSGILSLPVVLLFLYYGDFHPVFHEIEEYFSFIILLASLFIISGGIFLSGDILATPKNNTLFLAIGGVIANLFGTTGAAMLLIRAVLRTNSERRYVSHIPIFFIFLVCNIGGLLHASWRSSFIHGLSKGCSLFLDLEAFPSLAICNGLCFSCFLFFGSPLLE